MMLHFHCGGLEEKLTVHCLVWIELVDQQLELWLPLLRLIISLLSGASVLGIEIKHTQEIWWACAGCYLSDAYDAFLIATKKVYYDNFF